MAKWNNSTWALPYSPVNEAGRGAKDKEHARHSTQQLLWLVSI